MPQFSWKEPAGFPAGLKTSMTGVNLLGANQVEMGSCRPYIYKSAEMGAANGRGQGFAAGFKAGHAQGLKDASPDMSSNLADVGGDMKF